MDTLVSTGLPLLPASAAPPASPGSDGDALCSDEFLQMLADFGAAGAPEAAASAAAQWLPLTPFVANGISSGVPQDETAPAGVTADDMPAKTGVLPAFLQQSRAFQALPQDAVLATLADEVSNLLPELASGEGLDAGSLAGSSGGERPAASALLTGSQALTAGAGAAALLQSRIESPATPAPASAHVQAPLRSAHWGQEVGQRIAMMAVNGQHSGSLSLTPEDMGPVEVRITMSQDSASVWFGAQQADTRAALQDALPRLREMFAANGLSLGEAQVSHQAPQQGGDGQPVPRDNWSHAEDLPPARVAVMQHLSLGLVDTYA